MSIPGRAILIAAFTRHGGVHLGIIRERSAVSLSELAFKHTRGRLVFRKEVILNGILDVKLRALPYTAAHAYQLFGLPLHYSDPFGRQIIAQALAEAIPILTSDVKFKLYKGIEVIW